MLCILTVVTDPVHRLEMGPGGFHSEHVFSASDGYSWFKKVRPNCNSLEVQAAHNRFQPPDSDDGAAFSAACYAIAGKIKSARKQIRSVKDSEEWKAAGVVFNVAHPIADAGDDVSAGPIMELVVEFWPNHYMALYHAGMSKHALGENDRAAVHLENFLVHYTPKDGWRSNAISVLNRIGSE